MAIEQADLEKAVEIVNSAWVAAIDQTVNDTDLATRIKANAGLQMLRNFLSFAEEEVEKELGGNTKKQLSEEDIAEIKRWTEEHGR